MVDIIPQIAHFYHGNPVLSRLRYMSIVSFQRKNPGWQTILHVPEQFSDVGGRMWRVRNTGKGKLIRNYTGDLDIERRVHSRAELPDMHPVHQSDYLRWILLRDIGGWHVDTDILWVRSMPEIPEEYSVALCRYTQDHALAIGLVGSKPGNPIFVKCAQECNCLPRNDCQSMGRLALERVTGNADSVYWIPEAWIYPISWMHPGKYLEPGDPAEYPDTIGFHLFAGSKQIAEAENTDSVPDNSLLHNILRII